MNDDKEPLKSLRDAVQLTAEAVRLHKMLDKASSRECIIASLCWRYPSLSHYEADAIHDHALMLVATLS
jgi:hypothetical protein